MSEMTKAATSSRAREGTAPETASLTAASGWRGLAIQPLCLLLVMGAMMVWLMTAELTETEKITLEPANLLVLAGQHLYLTFVSAFFVLITAIPLGILLTRRPFHRFTGAVMGLANIGQAAPIVGLIVLFAFWLGFGPRAALVTLVIYGFLPVLKNTMVGLEAVDSRLVEAARGMGMSAWAVLWKVELPLAVPILLAGVRTALVLLVGSATLATFVNGGGLGLLITTGVNLALDRVLIFGAVLVAVFALAVDWVARVVEFYATPKGL